MAFYFRRPKYTKANFEREDICKVFDTQNIKDAIQEVGAFMIFG